MTDSVRDDCNVHDGLSDVPIHTSVDSVGGRQTTSFMLTRVQNAYIISEVDRLKIPASDVLRRVIDRYLRTYEQPDVMADVHTVLTDSAVERLLRDPTPAHTLHKHVHSRAIEQLCLGVGARSCLGVYPRPDACYKVRKGLLFHQWHYLKDCALGSSVAQCVRYIVASEMTRTIRADSDDDIRADLAETLTLPMLSALRICAEKCPDELETVLVTGVVPTLTADQYMESFGSIPPRFYGTAAEAPHHVHHETRVKKIRFHRYSVKCREYREALARWRVDQQRIELQDAIARVGAFPDALSAHMGLSRPAIAKRLADHKSLVPVEYMSLSFTGFADDTFVQREHVDFPKEALEGIDPNVSPWVTVYHCGGGRWQLAGWGDSPETAWNALAFRQRNIARLRLVHLPTLDTFGPPVRIRSRTPVHKSVIDINVHPKRHPKVNTLRWRATRTWLRWFLGDYSRGDLALCAATVGVSANTLREWLLHYGLGTWLPKVSADTRALYAVSETTGERLDAAKPT